MRQSRHLILRLIWKGLLHDTIGSKQCCFSMRHVLQVREDCPGDLEKWYRHISKGAWPFSTRDHGWPIADCSSEGLKVGVTAEHIKFGSLKSYHFLPTKDSTIRFGAFSQLRVLLYVKLLEGCTWHQATIMSLNMLTPIQPSVGSINLWADHLSKVRSQLSVIANSAKALPSYPKRSMLKL